MKEFMGNAGELEISNVVAQIQPPSDRVYYYNALDDAQRDGESEAAFNERVGRQSERFDAIASLENVHVRLGSVTGKAIRRKRQKQVDVQLAVDALTHAFNKNVARATFLAGDLDFKPVVDALVNLGVFTQVVYERQSASRDLYRAADSSRFITPIDAWNWSTAAYRKQNRLPQLGLGQPVSALDGKEQLAVGNLSGAHARAAKDGSGVYWVWVDRVSGRENFACNHERFEAIECFIKWQYGVVEWGKGRERLPGNTRPPWPNG